MSSNVRLNYLEVLKHEESYASFLWKVIYQKNSKTDVSSGYQLTRKVHLMDL